jgi:hypothetical protein
VVPCGEDQITPNGWWFRLRLRHCCRLSASAAVTGITCEIPCPLSPYAFGGNRLAHQPAGIYIMDGIRALAESRGFTLSVKKPWFSFHLIKQLDSDVKKKSSQDLHYLSTRASGMYCLVHQPVVRWSPSSYGENYHLQTVDG